MGLVPLFFLAFFASCFHVETSTDMGMGENMNVNMNDVDMTIGGGTSNAFDGSGDDYLGAEKSNTKFSYQDLLRTMRLARKGRYWGNRGRGNLKSKGRK